MQVFQGYYGDYRVVDELPFDLMALINATDAIYKNYDADVRFWPVTIDFIEKTGYWEVWFTQPVSDEVYEQNMRGLSESASDNEPILAPRQKPE